MNVTGASLRGKLNLMLLRYICVQVSESMIQCAKRISDLIDVICCENLQSTRWMWWVPLRSELSRDSQCAIGLACRAFFLFCSLIEVVLVFTGGDWNTVHEQIQIHMLFMIIFKNLINSICYPDDHVKDHGNSYVFVHGCTTDYHVSRTVHELFTNNPFTNIICLVWNAFTLFQCTFIFFSPRLCKRIGLQTEDVGVHCHITDCMASRRRLSDFDLRRTS